MNALKYNPLSLNIFVLFEYLGLLHEEKVSFKVLNGLLLARVVVAILCGLGADT